MTRPLLLLAGALGVSTLYDPLLAHLAGLGFHTAVEPDGDAAARAVLSRRPQVVLADALLRRKTGLQVCRIARSEPLLADAVVVLFAEQLPPALRDWARVQGADLVVPQALGLAACREHTELQHLLRLPLGRSSMPLPATSPLPANAAGPTTEASQ